MKIAAYIAGLLGLALLTVLLIHADVPAMLRIWRQAGAPLLWLVPYRLVYFAFYALGLQYSNPITAAKSLVQQMGEDPTSAENVGYAKVALEELDRVERSVAHLLRYAREEDLRLAARTLGASPAYTLWHVQIRAALPTIITGMRIAMGGAWSSIVAAEMLAATSGVGYLIMQAGNYLNTGIVFSGIITIDTAT